MEQALSDNDTLRETIQRLLRDTNRVIGTASTVIRPGFLEKLSLLCTLGPKLEELETRFHAVQGEVNSLETLLEVALHEKRNPVADIQHSDVGDALGEVAEFDEAIADIGGEVIPEKVVVDVAAEEV